MSRINEFYNPEEYDNTNEVNVDALTEEEFITMANNYDPKQRIRDIRLIKIVYPHLYNYDTPDHITLSRYNDLYNAIGKYVIKYTKDNQAVRIRSKNRKGKYMYTSLVNYAITFDTYEEAEEYRINNNMYTTGKVYRLVDFYLGHPILEEYNVEEYQDLRKRYGCSGYVIYKLRKFVDDRDTDYVFPFAKNRGELMEHYYARALIRALDRQNNESIGKYVVARYNDIKQRYLFTSYKDGDTDEPLRAYISSDLYQMTAKMESMPPEYSIYRIVVTNCNE